MYNKRVEVKETLGESSSVWLINDGKCEFSWPRPTLLAEAYNNTDLNVLNRAVLNLMECVDDLQETSWMAQPPLTRELFHHANNLFAFLRESKRVVADFIEKLLVRESLEFALVFPNHGISVELRGTMYERCYIINEELDQLMQHLWFSV